MELSMSMFATKEAYWKARAEQAETTLEEVAQELGAEPHGDATLQQVLLLKAENHIMRDKMKSAVWALNQTRADLEGALRPKIGMATGG